MAILRRGRKQRRGAGKRRRGTAEDTAHLERFIATRSGVEAFVEPQTTITDTTVLLVATDGEWTRRRVDGPAGAAAFAKRAQIPLYDVGVVGYPQRMREWNARRKAEGAAE